MSDLETLVRTSWALYAQEDFASAAAMMTPDAIIDWPVSGERIPSPANWRVIKEQYPGTWQFAIIDILVDGNTAVSRLIVSSANLGHVETPITYFTFTGERIARIVEYWPQPEAHAAWRAQWIVPISEGAIR
ncbi:MAG: nuclear transport factor 2 family protein [Thermomicrobiales bacterium]